MGMWDANSDRDYSDDVHGPYPEHDDTRHICKRCQAEFTKPASYPEWVTRICDSCRAELDAGNQMARAEAAQEKPIKRGAA